jgi:hypothetical protein
MAVLLDSCDTRYAIEGFGEVKPPQDLLFLVVFAGFTGIHHQKRRFLGGLSALQTSQRVRSCYLSRS